MHCVGGYEEAIKHSSNIVCFECSQAVNIGAFRAAIG